MSNAPSLASTPALEIRSLNKAFGGLRVAQDLNLSLQSGARHALIGPNGAGKTTFVNLITGVLQPDSGQVLLNGEDVTAKPQYQRASRGLARTFQINQLFRHISVIDNICLVLAERDGIGSRVWLPLGKYPDLINEAMDLLQRFSLQDNAMTLVSALPYGQQRLIEIVIALAQKPRVLLLDEPAAGVPSSESQLILDVVAELADDICVLIIEHDMDLVFRFARDITVLVSGAILTTGSAAQIAANPTVREVYLGESANV